MFGGDLTSDGSISAYLLLDKFVIEIEKTRSKLIEFIEANKMTLRKNDPQLYMKTFAMIKRGDGGKEENWINGFPNFPNPIGQIRRLLKSARSNFFDRKLEDEFDFLLIKLEQEALKSPQFHDYVDKNHVSKFYEAIKYSNEKECKIFVVKGNHDDDFKDAYCVNRINGLEGCQEISGKLVTCDGIRILGLGYNEIHYLSKLNPLLKNFKGKVDVVLAHSEIHRIPDITAIKPKLILSGHSYQGIHKISDTFFLGLVFLTIIFQ